MILQNLLVNGTFIRDPDDYNVSHECGNGFGGIPPYGGWLPGAPAVQPQMPGWVLRDSAPVPRVPPNNANSWVDWWWPGGPLPFPVIGPYMGVIYVNNLQAGDTFDFYQPIHRADDAVLTNGRSKLYQGKDVSFRCAVYSTNPAAAVQAFIRTDAGYVLGTVHSGLGAWEVLYVTATLPPTTQIFEVGISIHDVDTIFVDACTCVAGVLDPALSFIARPEEDDKNAINSMLFSVQDEFEIWAPPNPAPGSPTAFRHTITYPVTLRDYPRIDGAGIPLPWPPQQAGVWPPPPATPPGSALFFPGGTWNVWRESLSYSVDDAAGWACPLPWNIYVNLTLDARPT